MKIRRGRRNWLGIITAAWFAAGWASGRCVGEEGAEPDASKTQRRTDLDWPYSGMPENWLPWHLRQQPLPPREKVREVETQATQRVKRETPVDAQSVPLNLGGNDTLYGALLIPPLREGRCLPAGVGELQGRFEIDGASLKEDPASKFSQIDGRFSELTLRYRHGILDGLEASAEITSAGWRSGDDIFLVRENYQALIIDKDLAAPVITNLTLGGKLNLYTPARGATALALAGDVKIPLAGSHELATSGGVDGDVALLFSWNLRPVVLHANVGYVLTGNQKFPEGTQNLKDVWFISGGAVYTVNWWLALAAQLYVHGSAYDFIGKEMEKSVASIVVGPRFEIFSETMLEVGIGFGLTDSSSDWFVGVQLSRLIGW